MLMIILLERHIGTGPKLSFKKKFLAVIYSKLSLRAAGTFCCCKRSVRLVSLIVINLSTGWHCPFKDEKSPLIIKPPR